MTAITPDWITGILLAAQAQCVSVAIGIVALRTGRATDWRMAALLCVLAGKTIPYIVGWRGHAEAPDWLALLPLNAPLAVGPLFYTYSYARRHDRGPRREWLHYLPALFEAAYCCVCLLLPAAVRHAWKEGGHDHGSSRSWSSPSHAPCSAIPPSRSGCYAGCSDSWARNEAMPIAMRSRPRARSPLSCW